MPTFTGGCHCGKVKYEVTLDLGKVTACNCSMCGKKGSLLTFVPPEQFKLLSGEDSLRSYFFNKKVIDHLFCTSCGIHSFARGKGKSGPMIAINARCLDGVEPDKLDVQHFDGAKL